MQQGSLALPEHGGGSEYDGNAAANPIAGSFESICKMQPFLLSILQLFPSP